MGTGRWGTLGAAAGAAALIIGCGTDTGASSPEWKGDDAAYLACDDMASYSNDAMPISERQERMDSLASWAAKSDTPNIAGQGGALAQTAAGADATFELAADLFSATCLDLGYADAQ